MRHARWGCCHADVTLPRGWWWAAVGVLAWLAGAAPGAAQPVPEDAAPQHIRQALLQTVDAAGFSEAADRLEADALAALTTQPGTPVALPHTWQRSILPPGAAAQASVRSSWFTVDLAGVPRAPSGWWLYLPRWQTIGQIAVYADERLVYRSRADLVWNGFNHPLLLPLDDEGRLPPPATLRIRIDSQTSAGGALSSGWVGTAAALRPWHDLRFRLQVRLPEWTGVLTLGLGFFTLCIWLWRRQERTYLLFALFALFTTLRLLHFHLGAEPLPIPSSWFGWVTVNCVPALLVIWYYFVATLAPMPARWPGHALIVLSVVTATATLPTFALLPGMDVLAPLTYLVAVLAAVPTAGLLLWATLRHGGRRGIAAACVLVLDLGIAVHDLAMQNYLIGPESSFLGVLAALPRLLLSGYVVWDRYVGAAEEAEQAHDRLAARLSEREAALAESHARLRAEQHKQLLLAERRRLTQDIHDGMGSQLMEALQGAEAGQLSAAQMARVLRECIEDLKLTVDSLDPVGADLLLLLATLRYRLGPKLQATALQLRWEVQDVPPLEWLDPRHALQVLRILHEAISDIVEQTGARALAVSTGERAGGVEVVLEHDGQALPYPLDGEAGTGPGLSATTKLQRRARRIGAQAQWQPVAEGQRFVLWLPLQRQAGDGAMA